MKTYLFLAIAIVFEVVATTSLKFSEEFTRLIPSIIVVVGYAGAFYFLSITLKVIPIGLVYAIWSGVGIVLISLSGFFIFHQRLDFPAIAGMLLIILGVIVIRLFSRSM